MAKSKFGRHSVTLLVSCATLVPAARALESVASSAWWVGTLEVGILEDLTEFRISRSQPAAA
jgi:hypothetical protein